MKTPTKLLGYLFDEQGNNQTFLENGWLRTGDIGRIDDFGYLFLVDRTKDLLIFKNQIIWPMELEMFIYKNLPIRAITVVGLPHEDGDLPTALAVKKPLHQYIDEAKVQELVESKYEAQCQSI